MQERQIVDRCVNRLLRDEPIQHIVGHTVFCDNVIEVCRDVLIPRPGTEQLVNLALGLNGMPHDAKVMDACTGSGCIAISLKRERREWSVSACDVSQEALNVAKKNAKANDAEIVFSCLDILSDDLPQGPFDMIVSNPPYVLNKENSAMKPQVLNYEPHIALFVPDDNPLVFCETIARWGKRSLFPYGWVLMEINPLLSTETEGVFRDCGYSLCEILDDAYSRPRFIKCRL